MILITGFEPFTTGQGLVLDCNPTADIALRVAERLPKALAMVLPVSFEKTKSILRGQFEDLKPNIWLGLGYAPHRETLDIETVALNLEHTQSGDNDGESPWMRPIIVGAPLAYRTRFKEKDAISIFAVHDVTAKISVHAGTFLCNQSFFIGCHYAKQESTLKTAAFIHVPPMDDFTALENGLVDLLTHVSDA